MDPVNNFKPMIAYYIQLDVVIAKLLRRLLSGQNPKCTILEVLHRHYF